MTARIFTHLALAALSAAIACPGPAAAQTSRVDSQRGAELSLFGGAGIGGSGIGSAFGWSLGWRPSDRVAIEGSGTWTGEPDVDGFAAIFGPRFYLGSSGRAAPFISAEAGLFHASVNGANPDTPEFYLNRMPGVAVEKAFNDFVAGAGGGLDLRVRGRLWMRPQVRMLVVVDGWTTHLVAVPGVHFTYRFTAPSSTP
jgi:hypothetical protein